MAQEREARVASAKSCAGLAASLRLADQAVGVLSLGPTASRARERRRMVQFTYDHMHLRSAGPEATAAFCERPRP